MFVDSELIFWIAFETREQKLVKAESKVGPVAWRSPITNFNCFEPSVDVEGFSAIAGDGIASNSLTPVAFLMVSSTSSKSAADSIAWSNWSTWN